MRVTVSFRPLDQLRIIRDDSGLNSTEFALLTAMILRTDNATRLVRSSIERLAHDAGMSDKTARTVLQRPHVLGHFEEVERQGRQKNFRWHPTAVTVTDVPNAPSAKAVTVTGEAGGPSPSDRGTAVDLSRTAVDLGDDSGKSVPESGSGYRPSAFTSAHSSASTSAVRDTGHRETSSRWPGRRQDEAEAPWRHRSE